MIKTPDPVALPQADAIAAGEPPRMDFYAPIHKALRLFMFETLTALGRADAGDLDELAGAVAQLQALLSMLRGHVAHENDHVHPAMEARRAGSSRVIGGQHEEHLASIDALDQESLDLLAAPAPRRDALALRLYRHLSLFVAENLQHMHIEETVHNAELWAAYRDDELLALHDELLAHIEPDEMQQVNHWMAPALSLDELTGMLQGMKAGMPAPVFEAVASAMFQRMPERRRARLAERLGLPPVPGLVQRG